MPCLFGKAGGEMGRDQLAKLGQHGQLCLGWLRMYHQRVLIRFIYIRKIGDNRDLYRPRPTTTAFFMRNWYEFDLVFKPYW